MRIAHSGGRRTKGFRHAKYVTVQMIEVAAPRELFAAILDRIQRFGLPSPLVRRGCST